MSASSPLGQTSDDRFESDVTEASHQKLVIVDFWAEWCAPCRALGPVLELLAAEFGDEIQIVKANTDNNQNAAAKFAVSGIPAVFAVWKGEVLDQFQGALPEEQVRDWINGCLQQIKIEDAIQLAQVDPSAGEQTLREIVQQQENLPAPRIALAELLVDRGDIEQAKELIEPLQERGFLEPEAERVVAKLELSSSSSVDVEALKTAVEVDPQDFAKRLALAEACASAQQYEPALNHALQLVREDRHATGEEARKLMIAIFRVLPEDSALTGEFRRQLSMALY